MNNNKTFANCISEEQHQKIRDICDYVKNKSTDYDSFMNECGCYIFDNHTYGEPKFWFSIDKKGLLFFGYEEKLNKRTRVNIVYNSPISTGEKMIKDAINKSASAEQKAVTLDQRYVFKNIAIKLNGYEINEHHPQYGLINDINAFFINEVANEMFLNGHGEDERGYITVFNQKYKPKNIDIDDAKTIAANYFCYKVDQCIRKYEFVFNKQIIDNQDKFDKSIISMFNKGFVYFDRCEGFNSNFDLVPKETLNELIDTFGFWLN